MLTTKISKRKTLRVFFKDNEPYFIVEYHDCFHNTEGAKREAHIYRTKKDAEDFSKILVHDTDIQRFGIEKMREFLTEHFGEFAEQLFEVVFADFLGNEPEKVLFT
jgi:hypothetical protein